MDALLYVETVLYVLLTFCAGLAIVTFVFLAVRPFLGPRWIDLPDSSVDDRKLRGEPHRADANPDLGHGNILST